jgi:hypothetical protein
MRLLSTFYSRGGDLACGWRDAAGPDFDDLAALIADLGSDHSLDEALQRARQDRRLVRRTKPVTQAETEGKELL